MEIKVWIATVSRKLRALNKNEFFFASIDFLFSIFRRWLWVLRGWGGLWHPPRGWPGVRLDEEGLQVVPEQPSQVVPQTPHPQTTWASRKHRDPRSTRRRQGGQLQNKEIPKHRRHAKVDKNRFINQECFFFSFEHFKPYFWCNSSVFLEF